MGHKTFQGNAFPEPTKEGFSITSLLLENAFVGDGLKSLFHNPRFFQMHSGEAGRYFEWMSGDEVVACAHFTRDTESGIWRSPARGTYGGYRHDPRLPVSELHEFHSMVQDRLTECGAREIEILLAPAAYDQTAFSSQFYILHSDDYQVSRCDLNQSLSVTPVEFTERLTHGNQKRLKKCWREGLVASRLPLDSLSEVYKTIQINRESKGHSVSMTFGELLKMAYSFPESMVLFGVYDNDALAASAICLRVNFHTLYVFYWGDVPGYSSFSPVVSVAGAIYEFCLEQQIELLDLGTSTSGVFRNDGLIRFKRGLGCEESLKVRLRKTL